MKKSKFQFSNPRLKDVVFKFNNNFDMTNNEIPIENNFHVDVQEDPNKSSAIVSLTVETNIDNDNSLFQLRATMFAHFEWDNDLSGQVDVLLRQNAPALLLSYLRPIISNLTSQAGLPAYNLPMMNFKTTDRENQ